MGKNYSELLNIELEGCANSLKKAYKIAQKATDLINVPINYPKTWRYKIFSI